MQNSTRGIPNDTCFCFNPPPPGTEWMPSPPAPAAVRLPKRGRADTPPRLTYAVVWRSGRPSGGAVGTSPSGRGPGRVWQERQGGGVGKAGWTPKPIPAPHGEVGLAGPEVHKCNLNTVWAKKYKHLIVQKMIRNNGEIILSPCDGLAVLIRFSLHVIWRGPCPPGWQFGCHPHPLGFLASPGRGATRPRWQRGTGWPARAWETFSAMQQCTVTGRR